MINNEMNEEEKVDKEINEEEKVDKEIVNKEMNEKEKADKEMVNKEVNEEEKVNKEMVNKDKFREDLRVLAIDDNPVCLKLVKMVLKQCHYKVTTTTKAATALELLRKNKNSFDIVITDVRRMNDMDGFKLLETIGFEMDIPVIMMSSEDDLHTVRKGIEYGACDYLVKPVRLAEIQNIWQHVVRKGKLGKSDLNVENEEIDRNTTQKKRHNDQMNDNENRTKSSENYSGQKKPRFNWNRELQLKFIAAYDKLGPDNVVPSKLLIELSDVPGLTREIIASHLQKYRDTLKKNRRQKSKIYNGKSGQFFDATVSSVFKQGQSGVNCFNGIKANAYASSRFQYGHVIQNRDPLSHSLVIPSPYMHHVNQQDILSQQYSPNIMDENRQRMQVRELIDLPSNSIMMGNFHHQSYRTNGLNSQFFPSQSRSCNPSMEMPSEVPDYSASRESRSSNIQFLGCTSTSVPIHSSIDFAGMLDDAISNEPSRVVQNDSGITAVQNFLPGHNVERDIVLTTMESSNREHSIRIDQVPLVEHPFEHPGTDNVYQLSSCSSTDDDLSAALKLFQQ